MSKFLIETDEVDAVASSVKDIFKSAKDVVNSVDDYDVSCDEFDFSSAKDAILTNVKGAYGKFKLTNTLLSSVVKVHTELQDSVNPKSDTSSSSSSSSGYYYGTSSGSYSSNSYTSNSIGSTTTTTTTTTDSSTIENASAITEAIDIGALISAGTIAVIEEDELEEETKDNVELVVRIKKDDENFEEYMEIVYKLAKKYGIAASIIYIDADDDETKTSCSLIKNGEEYGSTETITEESIKEMLDGAPEEIQNDYKTENEFIYYNQGEYGDYAYAAETIANAGCGPTSTAMALTYLTGETVDPVEAAAWSEEHGYAVDYNGTSEGLFAAMAEDYGLSATQEAQTAENIIASLKEGHVIIAHMGPGTFTSGGHYIVLKGLDADGNVIVADPASYDRTNKSYPASIFEEEARGTMTSIWA